MRFELDCEGITLTVNGGNGFIDLNFILHMIDVHPNCRKVCLDKITYTGNLSMIVSVMSKLNLRFAKISICDREDVYMLFEEEHLDVIVTFAAESHVDRSIDNLEVILQTNMRGTLAWVTKALAGILSLTYSISMTMTLFVTAFSHTAEP